MLPQRLINGCLEQGQADRGKAAATTQARLVDLEDAQIEGALATQPCSFWRSAASFVVATWRMNGRFAPEAACRAFLNA